jgi:hypothetical protein
VRRESRETQDWFWSRVALARKGALILVVLAMALIVGAVLYGAIINAK